MMSQIQENDDTAKEYNYKMKPLVLKFLYLGIDIIEKEFLSKILNCAIKKELGLMEFQASILELVHESMHTIDAYKLIHAIDKNKPCETCHESAKDQRVTELISNVRGGRKLLKMMKSKHF